MRTPAKQSTARRSGPSLARNAPVLLLTCLLAGPATLFASTVNEDAAFGDAARGEEIYQQCAGCHSLSYNRTGPKHCGIMGRRAGGVNDYVYSDAMRRSDLVWTRETLDRFLANPGAVVPGTTMGYAGIASDQNRRDLIAFLESAGESPEHCGLTED
ncbi:c-type cytochrome [Elongatibacter sediminis]|uniref:Cytochrome c family protein n=1 Tax=Elongatibacter sediminis TaxID=3119006 RepID=A0AAW9R6J5_9GAMM